MRTVISTSQVGGVVVQLVSAGPTAETRAHYAVDVDGVTVHRSDGLSRESYLDASSFHLGFVAGLRHAVTS